MNNPTNKTDPVTHRSKGNTPARKLTDEPEFKKLAGMIDGGKIDKRRTLDHIQTEADHDEEEASQA